MSEYSPEEQAGEWTGKDFELLCASDAELRAKQVNAALAAEREKRQAAEQRAAAYQRQIGDENKMTEQLLASEREKREVAERSAKQWQQDAERYCTNTENASKVVQQLRSQLAEVEEHNIRGAIHPDALAKHIAEVQKPLVDALDKVRRDLGQVSIDAIARDIDAALIGTGAK